MGTWSFLAMLPRAFDEQYNQAVRTQFPHHDSGRYADKEAIEASSYIFDYVCPSVLKRGWRG